MSNFPDWLANKLHELGMTPADLARTSGKAPGVISRILNNERKPDPETLIAISHGLTIPLETVFRAAGLLPAKPAPDQKLEEAAHILSMLEGEDLEEIIQIARLKLERQNKRTNQPSRKPKPARTLLKDK